MEFADRISRAIGLISGFVAQLAEDGELSFEDLDQIDSNLDMVKELIQGHREKLEKALEDVGGKDSAGDLNNAKRI